MEDDLWRRRTLLGPVRRRPDVEGHHHPQLRGPFLSFPYPCHRTLGAERTTRSSRRPDGRSTAPSLPPEPARPRPPRRRPSRRRIRGRVPRPTASSRRRRSAPTSSAYSRPWRLSPSASRCSVDENGENGQTFLHCLGRFPSHPCCTGPIVFELPPSSRVASFGMAASGARDRCRPVSWRGPRS